MKLLSKIFNHSILFIALGWISSVFADNQTPTLSPILPGDELPFRIEIELADFSLPDVITGSGVHSSVEAIYKGKWLIFAGRTNGMHTFDQLNPPSNFPAAKQNTTVYVIDPIKKTVKYRSLLEDLSVTGGLTQHQIDLLSVTSPQAYQSGKTVYVTGGYGVITSTGKMSTKDTLTAVDVPGLMNWVEFPEKYPIATPFVRTISDPLFQVTGGYMTKIGKNTLLVFGNDFEGFYFDFGHNSQVYTEQVRIFRIIDDGKHLSIDKVSVNPVIPNPNFRRRDLNVVPIVERDKHGRLVPALVALAGVFTLTEGAWTVPVHITANGVPFMPNPNKASTFKQGMNNYVCSLVGLYSNKSGDMYNVLMGGISYLTFENGKFVPDDELPFTNQVTTIVTNKNGRYKQYFMKDEFPLIVSELYNPPRQLLFGTGAQFMPSDDVPIYSNGVLKFDKILKKSLLTKKPVLLGFIVGGIQSSVSETNFASDSAATQLIFKVKLIPNVSGCGCDDCSCSCDDSSDLNE
ncbi:MAG: hypothetical protein H0W88_00505 [Parachlamydiaceae bacterium]|nr:hypothetical protein [Parachlamydiaceae bacterium]